MDQSTYHLVLHTYIKWFGVVGMMISLLIFVSWCLNLLGFWGERTDIPVWALPVPLLRVALSWGVYRFGKFCLEE